SLEAVEHLGPRQAQPYLRPARGPELDGEAKLIHRRGVDVQPAARVAGELDKVVVEAADGRIARRWGRDAAARMYGNVLVSEGNDHACRVDRRRRDRDAVAEQLHGEGMRGAGIGGFVLTALRIESHDLPRRGVGAVHGIVERTARQS